MKKLIILALAFGSLVGCSSAPEWKTKAEHVHAVTDLSHEFTFYADNRFHQQYLPYQEGARNWCNLYNYDFSDANLLILLDCNPRIGYNEKDRASIKQFLAEGGGVLVCATDKSEAQNALLSDYGVQFTQSSEAPLKANGAYTGISLEDKGNFVADLENPSKWEVLVEDAKSSPVVARRRVGKGTLLVSSRNMAGSHPSARDSINTQLWKPLLLEVASGKEVDPSRKPASKKISDLEHNDDHGTFSLAYSDYMQPYADAMVEIYKASFPYIEKRMGVPLSPGMASKIALLPTGGGGFSSGHVVALAVWWGGFPERKDSMIEFLTHESVHSWVLPYAEVWNEPIATYVGNLVMLDMGYEEEALKRIQNTIERASKYDPSMKNYDIRGNLTGKGEELDNGAKNNIHWGKTYWVFEELRKENPNVLADYFQAKRRLATKESVEKYDMNNTVAVLSVAMGRDMFAWFNKHGMPVSKAKATIKY
ncbi:MAG: hypothetical protein ACK5LR_04205 [Mangrovibacterium sp.]